MNLEPASVLNRNPASEEHLREPWNIPDIHIQAGAYALRFARTRSDLRAAQRLRFEVFNLELGEGLMASYGTGADEDQFDECCHHMLVEHRETGSIVGTYRLMTRAMARDGFYSESEFRLGALPPWIMVEGVELGRACVASQHRTGRVIYLLWKGIAEYLVWSRKRYLFGCCSVPGTDPGVGLQLHLQLAEQGRLVEGYSACPTAPFSCEGASLRDTSVKIPPLFQVYLDMGAKVCSGPALDREFRVIDFLVVLDIENMDPKAHARFFKDRR